MTKVEVSDKELANETTRTLARRYSVPENDIRAAREGRGIPGPLPDVRTFPRPLIDLSGGAVVTSDWHVPYHRADAVAQVVRAAQDWAVKTLLIVGDFIDLPTLSRFDPRDIDSYVGMELGAAGDVLYSLLQRGLNVVWSRGNHENRFFRALKHQVDMKDLATLLVGDRVTGVATLDGEEFLGTHQSGTWLFTHPGEYSKVALSLPKALSDKFGYNVFCAHNHQFAVGYAVDGRHVVVESGGLFDKDKLAYLHRGGALKFPTQQNGFWVLPPFTREIVPYWLRGS